MAAELPGPVAMSPHEAYKMAADPPDGSVVSPDEVKGLMHPIMQRHQLYIPELKADRKIQDVHGFGEFYCPECEHGWGSYYSWITIDLADQYITYRWKMKCKECMEPYIPRFTIPETEKLIEKAVYKYKGLRYPAPPGRLRYYGHRPDPHLPILCEKCEYGVGGTRCWERQRVQ